MCTALEGEQELQANPWSGPSTCRPPWERATLSDTTQANPIEKPENYKPYQFSSVSSVASIETPSKNQGKHTKKQPSQATQRPRQPNAPGTQGGSVPKAPKTQFFIKKTASGKKAFVMVMGLKAEIHRNTEETEDPNAYLREP